MRSSALAGGESDGAIFFASLPLDPALVPALPWLPCVPAIRLAKSGLIPSPTETMEEIFPVPGEPEDEDERAGLLRARSLVDLADHKLKAAQLLAGGGFAEEARVPAVDAIRLAAGSMAALTSRVEPEDVEEAAAFLASLEPGCDADGVALDAVRVLSGDTSERDPVETAAAFLEHVSKGIFNTTANS